MNTTSLTKMIILAAPPETVWEFLTDKDKLGEWFHPAQESLTDASDYALMSENDDGEKNKICWGNVVLWKPHSDLAYTFTVGPLGGIATKVHWTLETVSNGTRLTMTHSDIPVGDEASFGISMALDKGWDSHFGKLRGCV